MDKFQEEFNTYLDAINQRESSTESKTTENLTEFEWTRPLTQLDLAYLADAITTQASHGGLTVDVRGDTVRIRHDPTVPTGTVVVMAMDGSDVVQASDWPEVEAALLRRKTQ